jgi:hypothetical protein
MARIRLDGVRRIIHDDQGTYVEINLGRAARLGPVSEGGHG